MQLSGDAPLSAEEWEGIRAARRLAIPLVKALDLWQEVKATRDRSVTVAELCDMRVLEARRHKRSGHYLHELKMFFDQVKVAWGSRLASDVTPAEVEAFIFAKADAAPSTLTKRRVLLSGLFNYAVAPQRRYAATNPVTGIKTPAVDRSGDITILTPAQALGYLRALAAKAPDHLAGEAIALFAGLRRAEVERLTWGEIRLEEKPPFIEVTKGKAKTRTRRLVTIQPCLMAILRPRSAKSGKVWVKNTRRALDAARKAAGWRGDRSPHDTRPRWEKNCLRHSFVSYHLAHFGNLALTELEAGHDKDIVFGHYRQLVTKSQSKAFWKIRLAPLPPPLST